MRTKFEIQIKPVNLGDLNKGQFFKSDHHIKYKDQILLTIKHEFFNVVSITDGKLDKINPDIKVIKVRPKRLFFNCFDSYFHPRFIETSLLKPGDIFLNKSDFQEGKIPELKMKTRKKRKVKHISLNGECFNFIEPRVINLKTFKTPIFEPYEIDLL